MTTNENRTGKHRTEAVYGTVTGSGSVHHGGGTPVAGQIMTRAWREAADAVRSDLAAHRALKSLRRSD